MSSDLQASWQRRLDFKPLCRGMTFLDDSLILGVGTRLLHLAPTGTLPSPATHDRLVALLAIAAKGNLSADALLHLDAALVDWRRGDKALAAIRLVFAPLPRLNDVSDAYPLFLAEQALDAGLPPDDLVAELGYAAAIRPLMKANFNPNEARVPARQPGGGRWDKDGTEVTPAFYRNPMPRPGDDDEEGLEGHPPPVEDEDGHRPMPRLLPFFLGGGSSAGKPVPVKPPVLVPAPDVPSDERTRPDGSDDTDEDGPKCLPEDDVGHGASSAAEQYEYDMSRLLNPDAPTFKRQPGDPTLPKSMAYFLYSPIGRGPVSYDDCKKTDAPNSLIPGIRKGDLVEYKNKNFFVVFAQNTSGYRDFLDQMARQNDAIFREGKGRRVYYCFENPKAADLTRENFAEKYKYSRFIKCN